MTDKELLELAAKAAGSISSDPDGFWDSSSGRYWNPLTDDGDALRLAVKLDMDVMCHGLGALVTHATNHDGCEASASSSDTSGLISTAATITYSMRSCCAACSTRCSTTPANCQSCNRTPPPAGFLQPVWRYRRAAGAEGSLNRGTQDENAET